MQVSLGGDGIQFPFFQLTEFEHWLFGQKLNTKVAFLLTSFCFSQKTNIHGRNIKFVVTIKSKYFLTLCICIYPAPLHKQNVTQGPCYAEFNWFEVRVFLLSDRLFHSG